MAKPFLHLDGVFFLFLSVITNFMASSTRQRLIFLEAEDMDEEM